MGNAEQKTQKPAIDVSSSVTSIEDIDDDDSDIEKGDVLTVVPGMKRLNSAISTGKVRAVNEPRREKACLRSFRPHPLHPMIQHHFYIVD